jgi:hypothetical protein
VFVGVGVIVRVAVEVGGVRLTINVEIAGRDQTLVWMAFAQAQSV